MTELARFKTRISIACRTINALSSKVQIIDQPFDFPITATECTIFIAEKIRGIDELKLSLTDLLQNLKDQIEAAFTYIMAIEEQSEREQLMKDLDDFLKTEAYEVEITSIRWSSRLKWRNRELEKQSNMIRIRPGTSATAHARHCDTISSLSPTRHIEEARKHDRGKDATILSPHCQIRAKGKPTQHKIVLVAQSQHKFELNLDESFNTNAYSGVQDTLSLESDIRNSEGNSPRKMMAQHSKFKDVLNIDESFPRDYPSNCSYVSETYTPQEWTSSVVRDGLGLPENNDDDQPPLEYSVKTPTKITKWQLSSPRFGHKDFPTLLSAVETATSNNTMMKILGWNYYLSDEECRTWMSITARTRLLSQISSRRWKPQQPHMTPAPRRQVAIATCSSSRQGRLHNGLPSVATKDCFNYDGRLLSDLHLVSFYV
ncbi:hypothetical protein Y032_0601g516 [Ancylostoma ceylanicum]|uniref:Uncharacterized protein n=1 Tax=Ancylostoma ceylanicum TaxID=53326 RepID=A0A016WM22_9BILA|nr:hypothetical protein Y032_0601g516 [Ancylostoma ceylanicum]